MPKSSLSPTKRTPSPALRPGVDGLILSYGLACNVSAAGLGIVTDLLVVSRNSNAKNPDCLPISGMTKITLARYGVQKWKKRENSGICPPGAMACLPATDGKAARIQCDLCPRDCTLHEGQRGACFVRQNIDNQMVQATTADPRFCIDPVKKAAESLPPRFVGSFFGTAGCNLTCKFCPELGYFRSRTTWIA